MNSAQETKKRPHLSTKTRSGKLKSFSCLFDTCKEGPFKSLEERTEHVRKHEKGTFVCSQPTCMGNTFSTNQTWLKHGVVKHQICLYCPQLQFNENIHDLAQHLSDAHTAKNSAKKKTYVCDICENFIAFSPSDLKIHQKGKFCSSNKEIYRCNVDACLEKFVDEKNAMNHVGSAHHACYWCQKASNADMKTSVSFLSVKELADHISDMGHTTGQKNKAVHCYICEECNFFTLWTDFAKRHLKDETHLKSYKTITIKDMLRKAKIGRNKSLATSLVCHFCQQSFADNKKETVYTLKSHILSKHHCCPFKGNQRHFGSCEFNTTENFSLTELAQHMSSKHTLSRQAEMKLTWCEACNFIAFTTNRPHHCRIKTKKSLVRSQDISTTEESKSDEDSDDDFEISLAQAVQLLNQAQQRKEKKAEEEECEVQFTTENNLDDEDLLEDIDLLVAHLDNHTEKNNIDINSLLLNPAKQCCGYDIVIKNENDNDYSNTLYNNKQLIEKNIVNFTNHLMYSHHACIDCFNNGVFDYASDLLLHINSVHNVHDPEKFIFENNTKFYCPICVQNALQLSQEELFNHINIHLSADLS